MEGFTFLECGEGRNQSARGARDTKLSARGAKCARLGAKGGEGAKHGARDARQGANSPGNARDEVVQVVQDTVEKETNILDLV